MCTLDYQRIRADESNFFLNKNLTAELNESYSRVDSLWFFLYANNWHQICSNILQEICFSWSCEWIEKVLLMVENVSIDRVIHLLMQQNWADTYTFSCIRNLTAESNEDYQKVIFEWFFFIQHNRYQNYSSLLQEICFSRSCEWIVKLLHK